MTSSHTPTRFCGPRFALLVICPVLAAVLYFAFPLTEGWTIWQRALFVAAMVVAIMVWGVIPAVQKLFRSFINPAMGAAD